MNSAHCGRLRSSSLEIETTHIKYQIRMPLKRNPKVALVGSPIALLSLYFNASFWTLSREEMFSSWPLLPYHLPPKGLKTPPSPSRKWGSTVTIKDVYEKEKGSCNTAQGEVLVIAIMWQFAHVLSGNLAEGQGLYSTDRLPEAWLRIPRGLSLALSNKPMQAPLIPISAHLWKSNPLDLFPSLVV